MWSSVRDFLLGPPVPRAPPPSPVTITGVRFPADGTRPHLVSLTTTTDGVEDGNDCFWGHVPDLRTFWKAAPRAWKWRDCETFRVEDQPPGSPCNGLYVLFFSFDLEALPENTNFPPALTGASDPRHFAGDAFVTKLKGTQIGEDLGEDGWAAWRDVPGEFMSLPVMRAWESL